MNTLSTQSEKLYLSGQRCAWKLSEFYPLRIHIGFILRILQEISNSELKMFSGSVCTGNFTSPVPQLRTVYHLLHHRTISLIVVQINPAAKLALLKSVMARASPLRPYCRCHRSQNRYGLFRQIAQRKAGVTSSGLYILSPITMPRQKR